MPASAARMFGKRRISPGWVGAREHEISVFGVPAGRQVCFRLSSATAVSGGPAAARSWAPKSEPWSSVEIARAAIHSEDLKAETQRRSVCQGLWAVLNGEPGPLSAIYGMGALPVKGVCKQCRNSER
jgi:hypothetical protein